MPTLLASQAGSLLNIPFAAPLLLARVRLDLGNPIAVVIVAVIVCGGGLGFIYWILSALIDNIILPLFRVPPEEHESHWLQKLLSVLMLVLVAAALFLIILPAAGIYLLPFDILMLLG